MEKRRRKKSRQGKRYSQINFVSTSPKNRAPPQLKVWIRHLRKQDLLKSEVTVNAKLLQCFTYQFHYVKKCPNQAFKYMKRCCAFSKKSKTVTPLICTLLYLHILRTCSFGAEAESSYFLLRFKMFQKLHAMK